MTNINRQAYRMSETAFLGNKMVDGEIILKELIYDREMERITKVPVLYQGWLLHRRKL